MSNDEKQKPLKAAIVLENWKLPVFRKNLTDAGFAYEDGGAAIGDTTILKVETFDLLALQRVVSACQLECKEQKKNEQQ